MVFVQIALGAATLLFGRRLFWLFVAAVGFILGLMLGPRLFPQQSELATLAVAVVLAIAGAALATIAHKAILAVVGFLAGGGAAVLLIQLLKISANGADTIAFLVGGLVGVILMLSLFDWGLIALSSVVGANLVAGALAQQTTLDSGTSALVWVGLIVLGIAVQARASRRALI